MTLSNLPRILAAFLEAFAGSDREVLASLFANGARIAGAIDLSLEQALDQWTDLPDRHAIALRPINVERRDNQFALTVLLTFSETGRREQFELLFRMEDGRIAALQVTKSSQTILEPLIEKFIQAVNAWDLDSIVSTFSEDALVNDQLEECWGAQAIRNWAESAIINQHFTMFVTQAGRHYDCMVVRANVDGDYDKRQLPEPLSLTFYFYLSAGKVVQLMILRNQCERQWPS